MLRHLTIENIALVDRVEISFHSGLNVLTGETGAGKSVIVTALALVLGDRAEREYVRHGASEAIVEAEFDVSSLPPAYRKQYAPYLSDNVLTVRREIVPDGTSKVRINGEVSTVTLLREMTSPIAEILGQHANQMLMDEQNHLLFLDYFASLESARESVGERFDHWQKVATELRKVTQKREHLSSERELLLFQKKEIEQAKIQVGEEEDLVRQRKILDSARTLMSTSLLIQEMLDSDGPSVMEILRQARKELDTMVEIDNSLRRSAEEMDNIEIQIEEVRRTLEQYGSSIEDDPARLDEINERLDEIYKLKKKYGGSEEAILKTLDEIDRKLKNRPDIDSLIAELEKQNEALRESYTREALSLSDARKTAAKYLAKLVVRELGELAIDNGGFEFEFLYEEADDGIIVGERAVRPFAHGLESGRFLFSANPGEPLRSLVKTASGGEISRVLLALKAAEKKNHKALHPVLVFDEVDAGIGGQTAISVADKISRLSDNRQVFVITHLHQIARQADHHYSVYKSSDKDKRAVIRVSYLDDRGRTRELDRMVALPSSR